MTKICMDSRLALAQRVVDESWPMYDGTPSEQARETLVRQAIETAFPETGITLSPESREILAAAAIAARRSQVALIRLRREDEARLLQRPDGTSLLSAWGAGVAARQARDWVRLVDQLLLSMRRYAVVDGVEAGTPARQRSAQRFARRCAAELGIATPSVNWIRPVSEGGDLVTLGDIAGCVPKNDRSVIFVRSDLRTDRERLRVVAHEVAHHSGADEEAALAYEKVAVRRHARPDDLWSGPEHRASQALASIARR